MSSTSKRGGNGPDDFQNNIDIDEFMNKILIEKEQEVVLYLDSLWGIESKRGWNIIQDIYGNLTRYYNNHIKEEDSHINMYVYCYENWSPIHSSFKEWWQWHVDTIPGYPAFEGMTKYRAILLVIQNGRIKQALLNTVTGEGGGFCVHKLIMKALGHGPIRGLNTKEKEYYERICVDALHHPERAKSVFIWGSPCGWHDSSISPPESCQKLHDEL